MGVMCESNCLNPRNTAVNGTGGGCTRQKLIADQASETTGKNTEWVKEVRRLKIKMRWAEAGRKN
jgi:hypothetical protein